MEAGLRERVMLLNSFLVTQGISDNNFPYISPWLILQLCLVEDRRSGEWLEDNDAERLVG